MNKYFLVFAFSVVTFSVFAQKKKTKQIPPPIKKEIIISTEIQEPKTQNELEYNIVMPENAATQITAKKINGKDIQIKSLKEFENIHFSELKELRFSTMVSGKYLDNTILDKIFNEGTQLEVLEIDNFAIESFPEIKIPNRILKKLMLEKNNLKVLPSSLSNLVALENFSSGNPLENLPENFSQLKNLKELGLHYTEFSEFPKSIFGLNKLTVLYVSGNYGSSNKIKEIPDLLDQLPNLTEFGVTNASLSSVPKSFSTLKKIEKVDFSYNQFADFPEVLALSSDVQYVPFANNPLNWGKFFASIKKIKWSGLFFLNETGFSKKQYEEIQKILSKIDVYYDGMND
ncbi:leucine-rich repeat domain-containing protein [Flavobacterium qiangtangense]|uniref:Leucine-rich repeat domain-containing protein n=1 Tax=Flavobacterium qiangtangense TaxID=1442595 RepID=A0ABW1PM20_9FLAO